MEFQKIHSNNYLLRLERGEEIVAALQFFAKHQHIEGGFFSGIGATDKLEIAHYSVENKKYSSKTFNQALELSNITGTISSVDEQSFIHAHGTFSDDNMQSFAGHIVSARISGTCELYVTSFEKITRKEDLATGLKVLDLNTSLLVS